MRARLESAQKEVKTGLKKAVNDLAKQTKNKIYMEARKEYAVKAGDYKKSDLKLKKATGGRLTAEISSTGAPLGLKSSYKATANRKKTAAKAQVKKAGGKRTLQKGTIKAFVSSFSGRKNDGSSYSHTGVLQRRGKNRLPIKELKGPGSAKITEKVFEPMQASTGEALKDRVNRMAAEVM